MAVISKLLAMVAGALAQVTATDTAAGSSTDAGRVPLLGAGGRLHTLFFPPVLAPLADSAAAYTFTKADGTTGILSVDSTNRRVGVNTAAPTAALHLSVSAIAAGNSLTISNSAAARDFAIYHDANGNAVLSTTSASRGMTTFCGAFAIATAVNQSANSTLHVFGSFARQWRAITAARTLDGTDSIIGATGTLTVTLPTAVGIPGRLYTVKNSGTGVITIATTSSQTIYTTLGAVATIGLMQGVSADFISDGANWQQL